MSVTQSRKRRGRKEVSEMNGGATKSLRILLIGDWVIDDDWVVDAMQSDTGSGIGRDYFRSLHHPGGTIRRLGAAGLTANHLLLSTYGPGGGPESNELTVAGVGVWNPRDKDIISSMFEPENLMGHTPLQITRTAKQGERGPPGLRLHNFGDVVENLPFDPKYTSVESGRNLDYYVPKTNYYGTTRIIRLYRQSGSDIVQVLRLDWESNVTRDDRTGRSAWVTSVDGTNRERVKEFFRRVIDSLGGAVDAVVVKDLGKGMVSHALISCLVDAVGGGGSEWFVFSKYWRPDWLDPIVGRGEVIRAMIVPEQAAQKCESVTKWVTSDGVVSKSAIQTLYELADKINGDRQRTKSQWVVVIAEGLQTIGMEFRGRSQKMYVHRDKLPNNIRLDIGVGKNTAFFTAMIYGLLQEPQITSMVQSDDWGKLLFANCLRISQYWMSVERKRLLRAASPEYPVVLQMCLNHEYGRDGNSEGCVINVLSRREGKPALLAEVGSIDVTDDVSAQRSRWTQATSGHGIILIEPIPSRPIAVFEPWRASTEIDQFVCLTNEKLTQLAQLEQEIHAFLPSVATRSKAGLIVAGPGSGKSHLVRSLAESNRCYRLEFNITTLMRRENLIDCFDQIVTWQSQHRGDQLLIFFDEINAQLDGHDVYDVFLAPLEDNYYIRSGRKHLIQPCIWLFAGTDTPADIEKSPKGRDFVSRLALPQIDLTFPSGASEDPLRLLETVYVGVSLARHSNPGLQRLDTDVFAVLRSLKPELLPVRRLRQMIDKHLVLERGMGRWKDVAKLEREYREYINSVLLLANREVLKQLNLAVESGTNSGRAAVHLNDDPHTNYIEYLR